MIGIHGVSSPSAWKPQVQFSTALCTNITMCVARLEAALQNHKTKTLFHVLTTFFLSCVRIVFYQCIRKSSAGAIYQANLCYLHQFYETLR